MIKADTVSVLAQNFADEVEGLRVEADVGNLVETDPPEIGRNRNYFSFLSAQLPPEEVPLQLDRL